MKRKKLLLATIIFFLLINTTYFWIGETGILAMFIFILLFVSFLILAVVLIGQVYFLIKEEFKDGNRIWTVGILFFVLGSAAFFPTGIMDFEKLESESLLVAEREGTANCTTTLKLKKNKKFIEENICFGISETKGTYRIVNDTIYFENVSLGPHESEFYEFATITKEKDFGNYSGEILRFRNSSDTTGVALWILKNELKK
ncbi:hypothetical protein [Ulvibacterium sp.]|uniref:hypothetical protein n=1 Tax=Ulvibacterium sp. TaxID=2665914 RepID=UPI00261BB94F|nr:hypothetical protein [Ulvibacterium sp.]